MKDSAQRSALHKAARTARGACIQKLTRKLRRANKQHLIPQQLQQLKDVELQQVVQLGLNSYHGLTVDLDALSEETKLVYHDNRFQKALIGLHRQNAHKKMKRAIQKQRGVEARQENELRQREQETVEAAKSTFMTSLKSGKRRRDRSSKDDERDSHDTPNRQQRARKKPRKTPSQQKADALPRASTRDAEEGLHPSWEARRKANAIQSFQGTKTKL